MIPNEKLWDALNQRSITAHPQSINHERFERRHAEYKSEKNKSSMKEHLEKIRPHVHNMIDALNKSGEWKMYQAMKPKFVSSTNTNEKCTMFLRLIVV